MQQYNFFILDSEGCVLLTLKSQNFSTEEAAFDSLLPVLNAVRKQYSDENAKLWCRDYSDSHQ